MKKLTITQAKDKGLNYKKLLDLLLKEKQIKLLKEEAKILREDSGLDAFMSTKELNEEIRINNISLKAFIRTNFDITSFKDKEPKLYDKYKTRADFVINREIVA